MAINYNSYVHGRVNKSQANLDDIPRAAKFSRDKTQAALEDYRLTPATLYNKIDPMWIPKDFLLKASLKIAETIVKPNGRLIISWPPRHGKSRLATIASPIWILENFPYMNIILSTYGADLSTDFGREVRDIFTANDHLLRSRIREDVKSVGRFMTTEGGGMLSVGLGGAITGKGADVFIIDDYIKQMSEAMSATKREADWNWFTGTAYHRLEPGASMIIIATRWHKDDLIGRILRDHAGDWDVIEFRAIADENDPLGREPGEALFPERYSLEELEERKRTMGTLFFNAIFQQYPEDDDSKLTDRDWIEIVDSVPSIESLKFARVWDFGGGKNQENDPTVGLLMGVDERTHTAYIMDIWRKRATPETVERSVFDKAHIDGTDCKVFIEQEPGASGVQLVAHYTNNILPEFKVTGSKATSNKTVRALPFLGACESGKVKILQRDWNEDFLREFDDFPDAEHDDQVDACAIAYNELLNKKPFSPVWGRVPTSPTPEQKADPNYDKDRQRAYITGATWGKRATPKQRDRRLDGLRSWNDPSEPNRDTNPPPVN